MRHFSQLAWVVGFLLYFPDDSIGLKWGKSK